MKVLFSQEELAARAETWADVDVYVHPTAEVHPSVKIGKGSRIWNNVQIRENSEVGEGCQISKDCYVCAGITIGNRVRLQNGISVYRGVHLCDDVFVGPHAVFTNDLYPRAFSGKDWDLLETIVGEGASIGANSTIICGNDLGEFSMIGAGSVLTHDTLPYELWVGNPAAFYSMVCRCGRPRNNGSACCPRCEGCRED